MFVLGGVFVVVVVALLGFCFLGFFLGGRGSLLLLFALFLFNNSYGFQLCNSGPVITQ